MNGMMSYCEDYLLSLANIRQGQRTKDISHNFSRYQVNIASMRLIQIWNTVFCWNRLTVDLPFRVDETKNTAEDDSVITRKFTDTVAISDVPGFKNAIQRRLEQRCSEFFL